MFYFALMVDFSPETKTLLERMEKEFFVPLDLDQPKFVEAIEQLRPPYREIGETFRHNLVSVASMVAFPFTLASASVYFQHFTRFHTAARIRALGIEAKDGENDPALEERRAEKARSIATEKMDEFKNSDEGVDAITSDICRFLLGATEEGQLTSTASDLLLQGNALAWNAFEILARDVFVAYLNETPDAVSKLVENPGIRKRFELPKISIDDLAAHKFDLSSSMGTFLSKQQDLSDLPTIKSVYSILFPLPNQFKEMLDDGDLWVLSQQRHLIMHQRGIIDEQYKRNTKSQGDIGTRLEIPPSKLEQHLLLGSELINLYLIQCLET